MCLVGLVVGGFGFVGSLAALVFDEFGDGLAVGGGVEFVHGASGVGLDGVGAQARKFGYLSCGQSPGVPAQDLGLPGGRVRPSRHRNTSRRKPRTPRPPTPPFAMAHPPKRHHMVISRTVTLNYPVVYSIQTGAWASRCHLSYVWMTRPLQAASDMFGSCHPHGRPSDCSCAECRSDSIHSPMTGHLGGGEGHAPKIQGYTRNRCCT